MRIFTFMIALLTVNVLTFSTSAFCCTLQGGVQAAFIRDTSGNAMEKTGGGWCNQSGQVQMPCNMAGVQCPEITGKSAEPVKPPVAFVEPISTQPSACNPGDECKNVSTRMSREGIVTDKEWMCYKLYGGAPRPGATGEFYGSRYANSTCNILHP